MCECDEGFVYQVSNGDDGRKTKVKVPTGLYRHDCEYIKARNALLDKAAEIAGSDKVDGFAARFSNAVNELAKYQGLVK